MKTIKGFRGKKILMCALVLISGFVGAGALHAGLKENPTSWEVRLTGNATSGGFDGYLGSARNSSDNTQYIGCYAEWYGPQSAAATTSINASSTGWCSARDRYGNTRSCILSIKSGTASAILGNMTPDAYVVVKYFASSDAPYCSYVQIANYSADPVKY